MDHWAMFDDIRFDLNIVIAGDDGEHVAIVYQSPMRLKDGNETTVGSMEVFRVVDGRITEVWNCGYKQGVWAVTRHACSTNWATTCWPVPAVRARPTLMDEARRGEELGFGTGVHLRAVERQGGVVAHRCGAARSPAACRSPPPQPITTPGTR